MANIVDDGELHKWCGYEEKMTASQYHIAEWEKALAQLEVAVKVQKKAIKLAKAGRINEISDSFRIYPIMEGTKTVWQLLGYEYWPWKGLFKKDDTKGANIKK